MLARKSALIFGTQVFSTGVTFIGFYFVAHYLGPETMGIVAFAAGFVGTLSFPLDMGLNVTHQKRVSEGKDLGECNGAYFILKGGLLLVTIALVVSGVQVWKYGLRQGFEDRQYELVIYVVLIGVIASECQRILTSTFSALLLTARQEVPNYVFLLSVPLKVVVAIQRMGASALAATNTIGSIMAFLTSLLLFRGLPVSRPSRAVLWDYLSFAAPMAVSNILASIATNLDKVILGIYSGPVQVGYLYVVQRMALLLDFHSKSVSKVIFPVLSERLSHGDRSSVHTLLNRAQQHVFLFIVPTVVMIVVFRNECLELIAGDAFLPAAAILVVVFLWIIVSGLNRTLAYGVVAAGYNRFFAGVGIMVSILMTLGNLILIPSQLGGIPLFGLGALGAALSMLLATLAAMLVQFVFLYKVLSYRPGRPLLAVGAAGLAMAALQLVLKAILADSGWVLYLATPLFGGITFLLVVYLLGGLTRSDLRLYREVLNPVSMARYIVSEIAPAAKRG